jgi:hypothetical protein
MKFALLLLALPLAAQLPYNVTISAQPGQVFVANFGAPLVAVTVYSGEVCSSPGVTVSGSWGEIRQIAEGGGINIVDNILVPATAQRAENKTTMHKVIQAVGYAGLATAFVAIFHGAPTWLVELGSGVSGGASVLGSYLNASETQVQATVTAALGALADPTAIFSVSNGACVSSRLMLGQSVKGFVPIKASLPTLAQVTPAASPALREERRESQPGSQVPGAITSVPTHPAVSEIAPPDVQVAGWSIAAPVSFEVDEGRLMAFAGARQ